MHEEQPVLAQSMGISAEEALVVGLQNVEGKAISI